MSSYPPASPPLDPSRRYSRPLSDQSVYSVPEEQTPRMHESGLFDSPTHSSGSLPAGAGVGAVGAGAAAYSQSGEGIRSIPTYSRANSSGIGAESTPMLRATSSGSFTELPHPLSPTFTPSHSPALDVHGAANDPFNRYSSMNQSETPSFANSDFNDGDSSRRLRPKSNLAYGSYDNGSYDDKDYAGLPGAGLAASGWKLRRSGHVGKEESSNRKKKILIAALVLLAIIIAAAVGTAVTLTNRNNKSNVASTVDPGSPPSDDSTATATNSAASPTATRRPNESRNLAVGRDGSTVYLDDGTSFIYNNTFGGHWNAIPFNDTARSQADVPPLDQPWDYQLNHMHGVNIGGWLTLEPFISPALFEPFNTDRAATPTVIDEWTLSVALGANLATTLEDHYKTFITERDFAEIAAAGLNWIRLPIPYWIIETYPGEPFLANVGWQYFVQALNWARKYGLRVNLDFHAVPGSQNGYNHSSKQGTINFLHGVMGMANAQRTLNYIRTLTQFISQDQYKNVVPMFSILNEPDQSGTIGMANIKSFYLEAYRTVRAVTGIGQGPFVTFADRAGGAEWTGFLAGADRIAMDNHPYLIFTTPPPDYSVAYAASVACNYAQSFNETRRNFGVYMAGEWSLAVNDCGHWLNNVGSGSRYDGTYRSPPSPGTPSNAAIGSCDPWNNWDTWTAARKADFTTLGAGNMDGFGNWFFWTWKTGFSPRLGKIANPMWNYQLGLAENYMPKDPRSPTGQCVSIAAAQGSAYPLAPTPTLSSWQTGGAGAGTIVPTQLSSFPWPPASSVGAGLPTYTATGAIITAPPGPTPTVFPIGYGNMRVDVGNGWRNSADSSPMFTPVAGCRGYVNPWSGVGAAPTAC